MRERDTTAASYKTCPGALACSFDVLIRDCVRIETEHGFGKQTFGEDIALITSELSEALEEYRNGCKPSETYYSDLDNIPQKPEGVPSELADAVIRILGLCGRCGIDIGSAILDKMAYNESRPFKHGGKVL